MDTSKPNVSDTNILQADLRRVKDSISQTASHAKEQAGNILESTVHDAKEKTAEMQENIVAYVKANPLRAIGFSILAGFVTALLIRK